MPRSKAANSNALSVRSVDGLGIEVDWSALTKPYPLEKHDFAEIDRQIALARAHRPGVELEAAHAEMVN